MFFCDLWCRFYRTCIWKRFPKYRKHYSASRCRGQIKIQQIISTKSQRWTDLQIFAHQPLGTLSFDIASDIWGKDACRTFSRSAFKFLNILNMGSISIKMKWEFGNLEVLKWEIRNELASFVNYWLIMCSEWLINTLELLLMLFSAN